MRGRGVRSGRGDGARCREIEVIYGVVGVRYMGNVKVKGSPRRYIIGMIMILLEVVAVQ